MAFTTANEGTMGSEDSLSVKVDERAGARQSKAEIGSGSASRLLAVALGFASFDHCHCAHESYLSFTSRQRGSWALNASSVSDSQKGHLHAY